jgi:hypothetical protein
MRWLSTFGSLVFRLYVDHFPSRWTEQKDATIRDFVTGTYILNRTTGGRSHPYSTSKCAYLSALCFPWLTILLQNRQSVDICKHC